MVAAAAGTPAGTPSPPKQRYYTAAEVALHSSSKDLWVSFLGKVYNLTPLITKYAGKISGKHFTLILLIEPFIMWSIHAYILYFLSKLRNTCHTLKFVLICSQFN